MLRYTLSASIKNRPMFTTNPSIFLQLLGSLKLNNAYIKPPITVIKNKVIKKPVTSSMALFAAVRSMRDSDKKTLIKTSEIKAK